MRKLVSVIIGVCLCLGLFCVPVWANNQSAEQANLGKVLIIYYSYTGNTEKVALLLQAKTNADIYKLAPVEPYDAENLRVEVKLQREQGLMPALQAPAPDIAGYDLIIVGNPAWGGDVPPPMVTLLNQLSLEDARLAYFCTSGLRPREYMEKFADYVPNTAILDGVDFGELAQDAGALEAAVEEWLTYLTTMLRDLAQNNFKGAL